MFERFTHRARQVLVHAQEEARLLGHDFLGTEHILLGILAEGRGVAARVLSAQGLTSDAARKAVEAAIGSGPLLAATSDADALAAFGIDLDGVRANAAEAFGPGALEHEMARRSLAGKRRAGAPPFTPRAKKTLELSLRQALELGHNYIGTEHLLLGLVHEGKGVAYRVLDELAGPASALPEKVIAEVARLRRGA